MKSGDTKKSFFIFKKIILSYLQGAILSVLVMLAVSAVIILLYSYNKGISFMTVSADLIKEFKNLAENAPQVNMSTFICIIYFYISIFLFFIICGFRLKKNLGIRFSKTTKWYVIYALIYFVVYAHFKNISVFSFLLDTEYYHSFFDVVINDIKRYDYLLLPLLIPPLLTTISSISKDNGFIAVYDRQMSEQNRIESERKSEQERKAAEKQRLENELRKQAEMKLAEQKRAETEKIAAESRQKAQAFYEAAEAKLSEADNPIADTDDTI